MRCIVGYFLKHAASDEVCWLKKSHGRDRGENDDVQTLDRTVVSGLVDVDV